MPYGPAYSFCKHAGVGVVSIVFSDGFNPSYRGQGLQRWPQQGMVDRVGVCGHMKGDPFVIFSTCSRQLPGASIGEGHHTKAKLSENCVSAPPENGHGQRDAPQTPKGRKKNNKLNF